MGSSLIKVGVTGYYISPEDNKKGWIKGLPEQQFSMFSYDFVESIISSNALPTLLPVVPKQYIKEQLNSIQALILAGGEDVHPKYYEMKEDSQYSSYSLERDEYEFELLKQALKLKIPILLVCRGMQLLNVLQNGTLYKDINTELSTNIEHVVLENRSKAVHDVSLHDHHFISNVIGKKLKVNSIHHQSIHHLGDEMEIVGLSEDDIIEVVTIKDREDIIAIQWHPEMMYKTTEHARALFHWLVHEAQKNIFEKRNDYEKI